MLAHEDLARSLRMSILKIRWKEPTDLVYNRANWRKCYDCEVHQYRAQGSKRSGCSCRDVGSVSASGCAASGPARPLRVATRQRTFQERALQEWALQKQEQELQERILQKWPGRPRQQPRQRSRRQWSLQRRSIWQRTVRTVPSRGNRTASRIQQSW